MADLPEDRAQSCNEAVAQLYHSWITGLVLSLVARKGSDAAEAFVFQLFRTQHRENFRPGLRKLGLMDLPHAIAAARYHYLSNQLGGVKVEYFEESARKAWVRYPPPRWIWAGTAICGIPSAVNRAMLRGWHAHNGVTLGNPRLGFVCTKTTVDGQAGLEGYYLEHDRVLATEERLQFRPEESCPRIDTAALPVLDAASWPPARQTTAYRNYAMAYLRNGLPVLVNQFGPEEARFLGRISALQIGMHGYDQLAQAFNVASDDPAAFLELLEGLLAFSGDTSSRSGNTLIRHGWRLFRNLKFHPVVTDIWLALVEGLLAAHNRFLVLKPSGERNGDLKVTVSHPRSAA